jgi:hypothetical protein
VTGEFVREERVRPRKECLPLKRELACEKIFRPRKRELTRGERAGSGKESSSVEREKASSERESSLVKGEKAGSERESLPVKREKAGSERRVRL